MRLTETVGTISVGPGEKPTTPALPLWPKRLKLLACDGAAAVRTRKVERFRAYWRFVTGDETPTQGERAIAVGHAAAFGVSRIARDGAVRKGEDAIVYHAAAWPGGGRIARNGGVREGEGVNVDHAAAAAVAGHIVRDGAVREGKGVQC